MKISTLTVLEPAAWAGLTSKSLFLLGVCRWHGPCSSLVAAHPDGLHEMYAWLPPAAPCIRESVNNLPGVRTYDAAMRSPIAAFFLRAR